MYPFILNSSNVTSLKRLTLHFPSLIQARHGNGKTGKWGRPKPLHINNSGNSNGSSKGSNSGGFGNFDDGSNPRASSELLFFSTDKSFASYPLDHKIVHPHNKMKEVLSTLMKPAEIKEYLDKYVIGQEHAKKVIAVAVYNHYCRLRSLMQQKSLEIESDYGRFTPPQSQNGTTNNSNIMEMEDDVVPEKSNILLIGPSGSGKTLLAKTVSRLLKVPFAMGDATSLTEAGYVGEDVDTLLYRLLEKAKFNEAVAQSGIVFLDEVDKIARAGGGVKGSPNSGGGRDVGGEGVQHALLKMLEGTVVQVVDKRRPGREYISFDTSNLLFVLSGAFVGLEGIVGSRSAVPSIGFSKEETGSTESNENSVNNCSPAIVGKNSSNWMDGLQTTDIISYGLIPEFIGRVPVVAVLEELDERTLVRTLTEPKNSLIKQYQHLFQMNGVELLFTDDALLGIGKISIESKTGARGLRGIMEKLLLPLMYDIPSNKEILRVTIEKDFVEGKSQAKFDYRSKSS